MARRKNMTARDILGSTQGTAQNILGSAQETAAKIQYDAGLDHWSRLNSGLEQQTEDFGNYLSSGKYTTADTDKYRSSANKAVEDLTAEMSRYGKSSDQYKTLNGYRTFYQNSLNTFDRLDVATKMNDYIMDANTWRSQDDYDAQRRALQGSIDALDEQMGKIRGEEKNYGRGNIDLNNRDTGLRDDEGRLMTIRSMSFNEDGEEILVPTIVKKDGRWVQLSDDEARDWYHETGEYLGKFSTPEEATAYAEQLHLDQEKLYDSLSENADYKDLQSWRDWYAALGEALDNRAKMDARFENLDQFVAYQNASDYQHVADARKTIRDKEAELVQLDPRLKDITLEKLDRWIDRVTRIDHVHPGQTSLKTILANQGDSSPSDSEEAHPTLDKLLQAKEILENIDAMRSELALIEKYEDERIQYENYGGYDPDFDYQAKVDELREARALAEEGTAEREKIEAQIRALAGENGDGTDANGYYDERTFLGRSIMQHFDLEAAQKRINEINQELRELKAGGNEFTDFFVRANPHISRSGEAAQKISELHNEKQELEQKIGSSDRLQKRLAIDTNYDKLSEEDLAKLIEAGKGAVSKNGKLAFTEDDGMTLLGNLRDLDPSRGVDISDTAYGPLAEDILNKVYAAVGAEKLGMDIGYDLKEVLRSYEAMINEIAGFKAAKKVSNMESDLGRWLVQVPVIGNYAGLNQFASGMRQAAEMYFGNGDYIPPNKAAAMGAFTREDLKRYGDKEILPGINLSQFLFDTTQTTANMLPMIAASYIATQLAGPAGAGLSAATAATVGKVTGGVVMGMSSAGNAYQTARGEGWSRERATAFASMIGTSETCMQYLIGGVPAMTGVTTESVLKLASGLNSAALRFCTEASTRILFECTDEYAQNKLETYLNYHLFGKGDTDWQFWTDDDTYTVMITALSTGSLEAPGMALNSYRNTRIGKLASGEASLTAGQRRSLQHRIIGKRYADAQIRADAIGTLMGDSEALSYTLQVLGSEMAENTEAHDLATRMQEGKAAKSARNFGELFTALFADCKTQADVDRTALSIIGGAISYDRIQRGKAQARVDASEAALDEVRKNNPDATVLDATATQLTQNGATDVEAATKAAIVINKILNGKEISASEMASVTSESATAKAARAYLGERNVVFKADMTPQEAEDAVRVFTEEIRTQNRVRAEQEKALTRTSVVQAAVKAANQFTLAQATAGADLSWRQGMRSNSIVGNALNPAKVDYRRGQVQPSQKAVSPSTAQNYSRAVRDVEVAKEQLNAIKNMSFEELGRISATEAANLYGAADAATISSLATEIVKLREREAELMKKKFPTKAERTELADVREKIRSAASKIGAIHNKALQRLNARLEEIAKREREERAKNEEGKKAAKSKSKGKDTVVVRMGSTEVEMTRDEFIKAHKELSKEEANKRFDEMLAQTAREEGEENNEQAADNDEGRNDLGEQRDHGENQEGRDQSEQGSDAGGNRSRRKLSTFDGSREVEIDEEVDSDATITRNDDVSGLEESHPGIREFTDNLMSAGFKRITYVSNGDIYNVEGEAVPGFYNNGELFLSLDPHPGWAGYESTAEHEKLHLKLDFFRQRFGVEEADNFISSSLQNILGEASYIDAFRKYWKRYSPVYLRNNDIQTVAHMVNEEMLCDMIGGIDNFGANLGFYQDSLQDILDASNFNSVADALANRPDENPGSVTTEALDPGAMPHNVPVDTLISGENVDTPSTGVASIQSTSRLALYGFTRALGFSIDGKNKVYYKTPEEAKARINSFTEVSKSDVENSPLGELIEYAKDKGYISEESMQRQFQLFADIGTISEKTADLYSAMQFYGSVLFTAMKLNSDKQYGLSEDIANICTKTQSMIDGMSEEMKRVKRGLRDDEILQIYQRNVANGLPVNCPECYVFSRWIGIGGLLDNIYRYQERFSKMSVEEVAKEYDELFDEVITKFKNDRQAFIDKAVANGMSLEDAEAEAKKKFSKGKSRSKLVKETEKRYNDLLEKREELQAQGKDLSPKEAAELEEKEGKALSLRALVWINNVYFGGKDDHSAKNVNPRFAVPSDILFDLNAGEEFALHYPEAWAFRTTQGAGYGKAIVPTAEANLGESILVTGDAGYMKRKADAARKYEGDSTDERHRVADQFNIFLNQRGRIIDGKNKKGTRDNVLNRTTKKGLNQLFLGGQRLQSTSDSRFDTAIDTLMIMTELQAMHAGAQIYTKVLGAVPFYDAVAGFVNMSAMPFGGGLDKDGNPIDTPTGGVDMRQAIELRKQCPRAGTITIGVNDAHIRAMFKQVFRDFIIPYHASGGKIAIVAEMRRIQEGIAAGKYKMPQSTDYTLTQTDKFLSDTILKNDLHYTQAQIDEIHRYRDMRIWLLTGGKKGKEHMDLTRTDAPNLTPAQENARRIFQQLYTSTRQADGKWYGLSLGKGIIEGQIFPNEFWDTTATYDTSGVNTQRYLDYCEALGVLHRFSGKGVKTGKAPTVDGGTVMRGHIYNVDGRDPTGAKVPLTDLAYQVDDKGSYLLNEYGERIIEPYFWKTLTDHRMYGNEGEYLEQGAVTLDGLLDLGNPNAEEAVAESAETFASKEKGFAHPTGEVRYDRKKSMKLASEPLPGNQSRFALAMTDAGYETSKTEPLTDDYGGTLYVRPSETGPDGLGKKWRVLYDPVTGALLNTKYIQEELGLPIYDNPHDEYVVEKRASAKDGIGHPTAVTSTTPSYVQDFQYIKDKYPETYKNLRVLDASSGQGLGTAYGRSKDFNVTDLEPYHRPGHNVDFEKYGGLIAAIEAGEEMPFDFVISNAVLNVIAQDAREELLAALLRMTKPGGQIIINPADTGDPTNAITLEQFHAMRDAGEDVSNRSVILTPRGSGIGREVYVAGTTTIQKAYGGTEFRAFAQDVAKQALGEDVKIETGKTAANQVMKAHNIPAADRGSTDTLNKGFVITRLGKTGQSESTQSRYSVQLTPKQQKNLDDNNKQTETGSKLKTLQGSTIQRYQNNVGKTLDIAPGEKQVYVHKQYMNRVVPEAVLNNALDVLKTKYPNFQYNTIMYNTKTNAVRFDEAPNFDTAREPIPGGMITVSPDGNTKVDYSDNIWHHKWMWVDNDYEGFGKDGVRKSWEWSRQWLNSLREVPVEEHKFESKASQRSIANGVTRGPSGWNEQLEYIGLPTDPASDVEIKDRKAEIARIKGETVKPVIPAKNAPKKQAAKIEKPATEPRYSIQGEPATKQQAQTYYSQQDAKVNDWAPEFYSKMQRTIEDWTGGNGKPMGAKMAANQVLSWLKGKGVKAEEIKWSGIVPYLEGKKTVTKDELLQVMAENEIKIETKVLGGGGFSITRPGSILVKDYTNGPAVRERLKEIARDEGVPVDQLVLKRLGNESMITTVSRADTGEWVADIFDNSEERPLWGGYTVYKDGLNYREILFKDRHLLYKNLASVTHWKKDASGTLAHARVEDAAAVDGGEVLMVEEIQSDLHNALARYGGRLLEGEEAEMRDLYQDKNNIGTFYRDKDAERYYELFNKKIQPFSAAKEKAREKMQELIPDDIDDAYDRVNAALNDAGYTDYDAVSWLGGEIKSPLTWDAWDDEAEMPSQEDQDEAERIAFEALSEEETAYVMAGREYTRAWKSQDEEIKRLQETPPDVPFAGSSDTYHEYVMKHLLRLAAEGDYDRLAWTTAQQQSDRWSDDFAEGYKIEYDQNIPKFMSKYVKQWGGKVGTTELDNGEEVWSVDITPEMRDSVLHEGQPLFSIQNDSSIDSLYPEGTLQRDLLNLANVGPEALGAWVNEQLANNEDALENAKIKPPAVPSKGFVPRVTNAERETINRVLDRLIDQYGTMRPSEKSNGRVLPAKNQKGQNIRRGLQNVASAKNLPQDAQDQALRFTLTNAAATYVPDSNKELLKNAKSDIKGMGLEHSLATFKHNSTKIELGTKGILQNIALGEQLLIETATNGDMAGFVDVLSSICMLGTTIGKSLQAFRLLKESGPIGELYYVQKVIDRMNRQNEERMKHGKYKEIVAKEDLVKAVITAEDGEARDKAMDALIADLASQTPVTLRDRWNAWRYLSMLGNVRTHARNIVGNLIFVPLRFTKDLMAGAGEFLATKAGLMEEEDRTKALTVSRALHDFALSDAEVMKKELRGNGKYNPAQEILKARKLLPGFLNTLSKMNGDALETEDWWFLRAAYARALSMQLSHSGFTVEEMQTTVEGQEALNRARKNAILEAQKATYRDFCAAVSWLNRGKQLKGTAGAIIGIGLDGVLPFTKTPINILRRAVEYSPVGLARGIGDFINSVRNGNVDMAEAIDTLAAGLTGTGVAVLGLLLARMGLLRGRRSNDDEENFDKLLGMQDYSLQIGDQSFTIDWAAPTALPLFVGAAIAEMMDENDGELELKDIWNGLMMIAEPMTSLSMLDGLNKLIESTAYASGSEKIATIATQAATSYFGQAFPTILGQVARTIDGTRRSTYVDKNSPIPAAAQRFVQSSVQAKIPGWENARVPYIDAWGRTSEPSSKILNGVENFFLPWYRSVKQVTDVDEELGKLYSKTKADILPSVPQKYFSVGGEKKYLTPDEWVSYATDVGQTKYTLLTQLISDPRYLVLSDAQKAKVIKDYIYKYANAVGKFHVDSNYDIHGTGVWIEEAEAAATDYERFERIWQQIEKTLKD